MKNLIFIPLTSVVQEKDIDIVSYYSFAGKVYQDKMIKSYPFKKIFSFSLYNIQQNELEKDKNIYFFKYKNNKLFLFIYLLKFIFSINKFIEKNDEILLYNIYPRSIIIFLFFKYIKRKKIYVLLADYEIPKKSFLKYLCHLALKKSDGIFSLSQNINIHKNTVFQELLIDCNDIKDEDIDSSNNSKEILFSGTISKANGIDLAIASMNYLPKDYTLHISGILHNTSEHELLHLIRKSNSNIIYHGSLSTENYKKLLSNCGICLSVRDVNHTDHLYNFPSKIGEYLSLNKMIISTYKYKGFEEYVVFTKYSPDELAKCIQNTKLPFLSPSKWLCNNFGFTKFNENMCKLVSSK